MYPSQETEPAIHQKVNAMAFRPGEMTNIEKIYFFNFITKLYLDEFVRIINLPLFSTVVPKVN